MVLLENERGTLYRLLVPGFTISRDTGSFHFTLPFYTFKKEIHVKTLSNIKSII